MDQLLRDNCLALVLAKGPRARMHANACVPLCKIIFVPAELEGGDLGEWNHPATLGGVHTCTCASTKGRVRENNRPPPRFNLVMGSGGVSGICEGHRSLKSSIYHCRLDGQRTVNSSIPLLRGWLALIINLLYQIHFIISPSLTHRWDEPSSKWQGNSNKVAAFKIYPASRS